MVPKLTEAIAPVFECRDLVRETAFRVQRGSVGRE
jgi:hypothetical protein